MHKISPRRRERSGRIAREKVKDIIAVAVANRIKHGVRPEEARNQLAGSYFGRLYLQGIISRPQYECGCRFGSVVARYAKIMGIPLGNPKSISMLMVAASGFEADEPDIDNVSHIKDRYNMMFESVSHHNDGRRMMSALKSCIINDQPANIGDIRLALNHLCRLWRIPHEASPQ